ncbi:MAG: xanthine dehydrogenase family protein subunit M [Planctomycetota bacterium]|nr:MAG: xanthine dehydrogenase family protein subunit M [Planctomycetota bacterium]
MPLHRLRADPRGGAAGRRTTVRRTGGRSAGGQQPVSVCFRPERLEEAIELLADPATGAIPIAGCTDLLVQWHSRRERPNAVLDLLGIEALRGIEERDGALEIGACTSFRTIGESERVLRHAPALAEIAGTIGAWQIQNRATIGGNIANASPAGDSLPVLLALGAELVLAGPAGERTVAYEAFHTGYRQTALEPGELIARVRIPLAGEHAFGAVHKVGTRCAQAISKVIVALGCDRPGGRLTGVRIGAGSVAPTPVRLRETEALLEGQIPDADLAERAGACAAGEVQPIDDVRSTARYRRWVLGRLVRRMVLDAAGRRVP